jgi:hypothetical protein
LERSFGHDGQFSVDVILSDKVLEDGFQCALVMIIN